MGLKHWAEVTHFFTHRTDQHLYESARTDQQ